MEAAPLRRLQLLKWLRRLRLLHSQKPADTPPLLGLVLLLLLCGVIAPSNVTVRTAPPTPKTEAHVVRVKRTVLQKVQEMEKFFISTTIICGHAFKRAPLGSTIVPARLPLLHTTRLETLPLPEKGLMRMKLSWKRESMLLSDGDMYKTRSRRRPSLLKSYEYRKKPSPRIA